MQEPQADRQEAQGGGGAEVGYLALDQGTYWLKGREKSDGQHG
jgi:hypothetical protein